LEALALAAPCTWWRAFLALATSSGMRVQEMLRLHRTDCDARSLSARVTSDAIEISSDDDLVSLRQWMPPQRERSIPLNAAVMRSIESLCAERPCESYVFVPDWKCDQLWRHAASGQSLTTEMLCPGLNLWFQMIQRRVRAALARKRGVPLASVHWPCRGVRALRATAVMCLAKQMKPKELAEYLGVSHAGTIRQYYEITAVAPGGAR
jgi:integrase